MSDPIHGKPNILVVMVDDMGFSDIGCFGGEIATPNLDALARRGVRATQMYNCARCCPTRAALLTGLYPHQAGIGLMTDDDGWRAYQGYLRRDTVTIAEALRGAGYRTFLSGKWHVGGGYAIDRPETWGHAGDDRHPTPRQRGFDRFYGILAGACNYFHPRTLMEGDAFIHAVEPGYHLTDAIGARAAGFVDEACDDGRPFFGYIAFTAPHWPLQAHEADIAPHAGRYACGWDALRAQRLARQRELGIVDEAWRLTPRDGAAPPWDEAPDQAWEARRMAVYAAQIAAMDRAVGVVVERCRRRGVLDDTLILFLSDNGGCAEFLREDDATRAHPSAWSHDLPGGRRVRAGNLRGVDPGPDDTFMSYDLPWANASNTPFRYYKHWTHEGGVATPLVAHWPNGRLPAGALVHDPAHVIDILPTCCAAAGVVPPRSRDGQAVQPPEGVDLLPLLRREPFARGRPLFWEHEGNCAVRDGRWKLVKAHRDARWELYDMARDRTELDDRAADQPERVRAMRADYDAWAQRCEVRPWPLHAARAR